MIKIDELAKEAISKIGSRIPGESIAATEIVAEAADAALYNTQIMEGAVAEGIFYTDPRLNHSKVNYQIDPFADKDMKDYMAWELSSTGGMPTRMVFGAEKHVNTFIVTNSLTWPLGLVREAQYDYVARLMTGYINGVLQKNNRDAFKTVLAAAKARAVASSFVVDSTAGNGVLTPALLWAMDDEMRIRGGGNSTSLYTRKVSDYFLGTTGLNQMRGWGEDKLPVSVRENVWNSGSGTVAFPGYQFHGMTELNAGGEYYTYYTGLSDPDFGSSGTDTGLILGLDLSDRMVSFVHPIVDPFKSYPEGEIAFKRNEGGIWGRGEWGWAVLDDRYTIIGTY